MHKITIYNLGNADTSRIDLSNGRKVLIDYADMRCDSDPKDKRADLPVELRADLKNANRDYYDVVAFTHLDEDHTCGASSFFELLHAEKYQGGNRIKIKELWVPAAVLLEQGCEDETRILRQEARYRLKNGKGIRVFSSPGLMDNWLSEQSIEKSDIAHLITDAGNIAPGFDLSADGVEFFIHSPFASRTSDNQLLNRNSDALTFQATFQEGGQITRMHFFSDIDYEVIKLIVQVTEYYAKSDPSRFDRLKWDLFKIAHHCSYKSLGLDKGKDKTVPDPDVKKLFETYGEKRSRMISTSWPIPNDDGDKQPPHRQAANYYKEQAKNMHGQFLVTMEEPNILYPEPIVIKIDRFGASVGKAVTSGSAAAVSSPAPRAGKTIS